MSSRPVLPTVVPAARVGLFLLLATAVAVALRSPSLPGCCPRRRSA